MTYGQKIEEMINVIHSLMEEAEALKEFHPLHGPKWSDIYRSFKYMDVPLVEMLYRSKKDQSADQELGEEFDDDEEGYEDEEDFEN